VLQFWDTRSANPMMTMQLPERVYCADVVSLVMLILSRLSVVVHFLHCCFILANISKFACRVFLLLASFSRVTEGLAGFLIREPLKIFGNCFYSLGDLPVVESKH